jgi:hypothetical protein
LNGVEVDVIDVQAFYRELGAVDVLNQDQQIILEGQVRVACTERSWTAIFEGLPADLTRMSALMEVCQALSHVVPMTTRYRNLAVQAQHHSEADETFTGLQNLRSLMRHMRPLNSGE